MVIRIGKRVEHVIDLIRLTLEADGGDIKLLRIDENRGVVHVRFTGRFLETPQAVETLRSGVEEALKREVPQIKEVVMAGRKLS